MTVRGPIFDGRAKAAVRDWLDESKREIAVKGVDDVQAHLGSVLKNPSGYYESKITKAPSRDDWRVIDQGVVYGSWLEGTSSRNSRTRFKGYATFRRIAQRLQAEQDGITRDVLRRFMGRMQ